MRKYEFVLLDDWAKNNWHLNWTQSVNQFISHKTAKLEGI